MAPARRLRTLIATAVVGASVLLVAPMPASAASTTISIELDATTATTYETTFIDGMVSPAGATTLVVLQREVDGAWKDIGGAETEADGSYEVTLYPHVRGTYHLRVRSRHGSVVSDDVTLTVTPHPTELSAHASPSEVVAGQQTGVYGYVIEPGATPRVVVQRKIGNAWSDRQSGAVNPKTGRFTVFITPSSNGLYTLRVRSAGGSRWSKPFYVSVAPKPIP